MGLVKSKNTRPEMIVRRLVHALGYRYRLHAKDLPGKPDLVFRSRGKVIFVHGCFWHRHAGCSRCRLPKSKLEFWEPKLLANKQRGVPSENGLQSTLRPSAPRQRLQWPEFASPDLGSSFPEVIAGQVDMLPAERGEVLQHRVVHRLGAP